MSSSIVGQSQCLGNGFKSRNCFWFRTIHSTFMISPQSTHNFCLSLSCLRVLQFFLFLLHSGCYNIWLYLFHEVAATRWRVLLHFAAQYIGLCWDLIARAISGVCNCLLVTKPRHPPPPSFASGLCLSSQHEQWHARNKRSNEPTLSRD